MRTQEVMRRQAGIDANDNLTRLADKGLEVVVAKFDGGYYAGVDATECYAEGEGATPAEAIANCLTEYEKATRD